MDDLPGMWEEADFTGGAPDVVRGPIYVSIEKPEKFIFTPCGHNNTGTLDKPASYMQGCEWCGKYYCPSCNYDTHRCGYCGDEQTHAESTITCPSYMADNPGEFL